jgi:CDP-diacylglycerol--serine O-phosphatidyltransferase
MSPEDNQSRPGSRARRRKDSHLRVTRISKFRENGASPRGIYLLPNLVTSAGLFCGVFAIAQTLEGYYFTAAFGIIAAQFFDGLDGRVARMTNTTSRFGVEYDSLCDLVSFGVAPAVLVFKWALVPWGVWGWLATALFVCCAAVRLARFNLMVERIDRGYFLGLPVPAAAALLVGCVFLYNYLGHASLPDKRVALLLLTYALAVLMVSSVPYPSFKQINLNGAQPLWVLVLAIVGLQLIVARYDVVIFTLAATYAASGPVMWGVRRIRGRDLDLFEIVDSPDFEIGDDEDEGHGSARG